MHCDGENNGTQRIAFNTINNNIQIHPYTKHYTTTTMGKYHNYQNHHQHHHHSYYQQPYHPHHYQNYQHPAPQYDTNNSTQQNYYQQFGGEKNLVPLDGIQSGVPTRTTPTLTPTTLRNIEQTLLDWSNDVDRPMSTPCQAGFVPPLVPSTTISGFIDTHDTNSIDSGSESGSQNSWHTPIIHEENSLALTDTSSVATIYNSNGSPSLPIATSTATIAATTIPSVMPNVTTIGGSMTAIIPNSNNGNQSRPTTSKRSGGRRPTKPNNLSPEEEEKRKIRRERNKLAAARCRKRRVDQTNELIEKVDQLEKEKQGLQQKIEELKMAADELEMCLTSHQPSCKLLISSQPNHNNNNNRLSSASPCDMKPIIMTATTNGGAVGVIGNDIGILGSNDENEYELKSIKTEPLEHHHHNHNHHSMIDSLDDVGGPPSPKRIMLTANNPIVGQASITPPLPNVSTISSTIAAAVTSILNTPTITTPPPPSSSSLTILSQPTVIAPPVTTTDGATGTIAGNGNVPLPLSSLPTSTTAIATKKPNRPSSLNVPLTITPSQSLGLTTTKNVSDIIGVPITTPSSGVTFNFDSLMDGGTGLTPVTAPLIPTCSSQNSKQNPLDLITPTSESSKLVSL